MYYKIYLFEFVIILLVIISSFTKRKDPDTIVELAMGSANTKQIVETRESYSYWNNLNSVIIIIMILFFMPISSKGFKN